MLHPKHTGPQRHHRRRFPSLQATFKLAHWKRLGDVEETKKDKAEEAVDPIGRAEEKGDPYAGDLVDDDELRIFAAGFAGNDGGSGDAESDGESDPDKEADEQA